MQTNVLVSVDIEGVANVWSREQTTPGAGPSYEAARRWMSDEANAAALGAFEAGAHRVVVADAHGQYANLLPDQFDPRVEFVLGKPRPHGMLAGIDDGIAGALLIGWHARAGSPGVLAHTTNSQAFAAVLLDGVEVGEFGLYAALAAERGVPIWMASGCDRFAVEVAATAPQVPVAVVKWSHGARSGRSLSPSHACEAIHRASLAAVRFGLAEHAASPRKPIPVAPSPRALRIRCMTPAHADLFCLWPTLERFDAVTVGTSCASAHDAVATVNALSAMAQSLR